MAGLSGRGDVAKIRSAQSSPELVVDKVSLAPLEAPQVIIERESTVIFNEYGHADVFNSCSNCSSAP
jgi:hypothetical protein